MKVPPQSLPFLNKSERIKPSVIRTQVPSEPFTATDSSVLTSSPVAKNDSAPLALDSGGRGTQAPELSASLPVKPPEPSEPATSYSAQPIFLETPTSGSETETSPRVNFELQGLIGSFLENPEVKDSSRQGTAGRNLGKLMDILSNQLGEATGNQSGNVYLSGDTEGRELNDFNTLKEQGVLVKDSDGNLSFRDQNASFVFMGDLMDRGPAGLSLADEMLSLKKSAPERVAFIWGNRDLGKLAIHNDLPDLRALRGAAGERYSDWLKGKLPEGQSVEDHNTDGNQVQYWLESHSAPQALEFHRQGLEQKLGRSVDSNEAARHYVEAWLPGGTFFEFTKQGSFAAPPELMGDTHMAFHGGAARENISAIPGEATLPKDLDAVVSGQYDLGKRLIAEAEEDLKAGRPVKSMLLSLGDSNWMASVGINAARAESFIYSQRNVEDGNYRGHEPEVARAMQQVGKSVEFVGHTPIGSIPEIRVSPEGTAKIYTDSSMSSDGSQAMMVRKGDLTISVGRVGTKDEGQVVFFAHKPGVDSPLGKITSDGYAVTGLTLDGNYFLSKYAERHKLSQKTVTAEELKTLQPKPQRPEESTARLKTHQQVSAAIENKMSEWNSPILDFESLDQIRGSRTPLLVSAASSYGRHPATQDQLLAMSQSLQKTFGADLMVIDGGTSVKSNEGEKSPEMIVQDVLFPKGQEYGSDSPRRVAAMPSVANLDDVTHRPDAVVVCGGASEWHLPAIESSRYAGSRGGASVFIGGGGAIAKAIEAARSLTETPVFLVAGRGEEPMGASDKVSRESGLPAHFHVIHADELHELGPRIQAVTKSDVP